MIEFICQDGVKMCEELVDKFGVSICKVVFMLVVVIVMGCLVCVNQNGKFCYCILGVDLLVELEVVFVVEMDGKVIFQLVGIVLFVWEVEIQEEIKIESVVVIVQLQLLFIRKYSDGLILLLLYVVNCELCWVKGQVQKWE